MTYYHCGTLSWRGVCHFDTKPHFFPEAPCQNDIPPTPPGQSRKKNFVKIFGEKKNNEISIWIFRQKFWRNFFFEIGRMVWGVCHFDTKPQNFPEAPCQNDIPPITYMIMWYIKNDPGEDDLLSLWYPIMKRGMSFWHAAQKIFPRRVSKWHTPRTPRPAPKKIFRQNFWRKI